MATYMITYIKTLRLKLKTPALNEETARYNDVFLLLYVQ